MGGVVEKGWVKEGSGLHTNSNDEAEQDDPGKSVLEQ